MQSKWKRVFIGTAAAAVLILVVAFFVGLDYGTSGQAKAGSTTSSTQASKPQAKANPAVAKKCATWETGTSDYSNNRWFADGIAAIKNATTAEQATDAAHVWLAKVRKDPNLLAGAAKYFLQRDVDKATLTKDGCATDAAVQLDTELELAIGQAKSIVPGDAPSSGYNSGVDNGVVVGSASAGIGGDRKAIQITLSDGRVIWIMARCGNIVTTGTPPVPHGPTDNPPVCQYNVNLPPNSPDCVPPPVKTCVSEYGPGYTGTYPVCKGPSTEDPVQHGNAGNGGGVNQNTGLDAPNTWTPPPAAPRVNPAPPAAVTPPAPPQVNTQPSPDPQPTVDPGTQPPNNGVIGDSGDPSNPDPVNSGTPCNPDFQNCP